MAITAKTIVTDLFAGGSQIGDEFFGSAGNDPALATSLPAEAKLRNSLSFANIRVSFPTAGPLPVTNLFSPSSISFPAYVTKLSNQYNIGIRSREMYGRLDPIPVFTGNKRTISVSLTIPCFDAKDANENLKKINTFIKNLYPGYNEFKGDLIVGSTPLVRVKFANLITDHRIGFRGLLGYITSFKHNFDTKEGFFFDTDEGNTTNLFFRSYTIDFTMSVLHESIFSDINGSGYAAGNYPYRPISTLLDPINVADAAKKREQRFGLSGDLSEGKILR